MRPILVSGFQCITAYFVKSSTALQHEWVVAKLTTWNNKPAYTGQEQAPHNAAAWIFSAYWIFYIYIYMYTMVCVHIYIYTYTHIYMYTHRHTYIKTKSNWKRYLKWLICAIFMKYVKCSFLKEKPWIEI